MLLSSTELKTFIRSGHIKIPDTKCVAVEGVSLSLIGFLKEPSNKPGVFTYRLNTTINPSRWIGMIKLDDYFLKGEVTFNVVVAPQTDNQIVIHYRPLEKNEDEPTKLGSIFFFA